MTIRVVPKEYSYKEKLKELQDLLSKEEEDKAEEEARKEILKIYEEMEKKKLKEEPRFQKPSTVKQDKVISLAQGGKVLANSTRKTKKYSYRRGGMTTLRKPKRG